MFSNVVKMFCFSLKLAYFKDLRFKYTKNIFPEYAFLKCQFVFNFDMTVRLLRFGIKYFDYSDTRWLLLSVLKLVSVLLNTASPNTCNDVEWSFVRNVFSF